MLMHKFGREFSLAVMENRDDCVSPRVRAGACCLGTGVRLNGVFQVTRKLTTETPPESLIEAYMEEIANGYGVPYIARLPKDRDGDEDDSGGGGGLSVSSPSSSHECLFFHASAFV